ncbi:deoxyribose-phosphate aldolase [Spongorhabdus nitratireducens]
MRIHIHFVCLTKRCLLVSFALLAVLQLVAVSQAVAQTMAHAPDQQQARSNALLAIQHTDHTRLPKPGQTLTNTDIAEFCKRVVENGERYKIYPAAICIPLEYLNDAKEQLAGTDVKVAVVVNFPHGGPDIASALDQIAAARRGRADEVDLVVPYNEFKKGHSDIVAEMVKKCKNACGGMQLKAILETGALDSPGQIRKLAGLVLDSGADTIKTSTGMIAVGATENAVQTMAEVIKARGSRHGLKISGGIRTCEDAERYLAIVNKTLGAEWVDAHLRFGASSLYPALVNYLYEQPSELQASGSY